MDSLRDKFEHIIDIRYVERLGELVLQVCYDVHMEYGELVFDWQDVRTVDAED